MEAIRNTKTFYIEQPALFKIQVLNWANQFNICCLLDSHQYTTQYSSSDFLAGVDAVEIISSHNSSISQLYQQLQSIKDWHFGHISYEYTRHLLPSVNFKPITNCYDAIAFFVPRYVLQLHQHQLSIACLEIDPVTVYESIINYPIPAPKPQPSLQFQPKISKSEYVATLQNILSHIQRGDCYEINFCQEFYAEQVHLNPLMVYQNLTKLSPTPFAAYYKINHRFLMCASPERYLKKMGTKIISQPIKGTMKRNLQDTSADDLLKTQLYQSSKNRSENVMIVDLVRNDMSRVCLPGSVEVEELFGIYSYPQVHQMISTIKGEVDDNTFFLDIINNTFPMGSMTGAPKEKVIELINNYEVSNRDLYSGAVGYVTPNGDFDFNVVIRSLMYNQTTNYLSYQVGGGITFYSDPEDEYEECLVKAAAMQQAVSITI